MTTPEPQPPPAAPPFYQRVKKKTDKEVAKLVLCGEEYVDDEIVRLRRRFHLHLGLIGCSAVLTFMMVFSILDATIVAGSSVCIQVMQEYLDLAGRF
jgi:hypothetical protein